MPSKGASDGNRPTPHWDIADALQEGYGVEDIAIRQACTQRFVRMAIAGWRAQGRLRRVLKLGSVALGRRNRGEDSGEA